jgi:Raf kinase inhibitor-like YbhB/YbcL family protein
MMEKLLISSPDFSEGDWIPRDFSARGKDLSPEIHIAGICDQAVSMAITMDDASHPLFPNYNHWVIWNLPIQPIIPGSIPKCEKVVNLSDAFQGIGYGKHCYKGPKPPFRSIHKYTFTVYILDCKILLFPKSNRDDLLVAMEGHILQKATLSGKFQSFRKEI